MTAKVQEVLEDARTGVIEKCDRLRMEKKKFTAEA